MDRTCARWFSSTVNVLNNVIWVIYIAFDSMDRLSFYLTQQVDGQDTLHGEPNTECMTVLALLYKCAIRAYSLISACISFFTKATTRLHLLYISYLYYLQ